MSAGDWCACWVWSAKFETAPLDVRSTKFQFPPLDDIGVHTTQFYFLPLDGAFKKNNACFHLPSLDGFFSLSFFFKEMSILKLFRNKTFAFFNDAILLGMCALVGETIFRFAKFEFFQSLTAL